MYIINIYNKPKELAAASTFLCLLITSVCFGSSSSNGVYGRSVKNSCFGGVFGVGGFFGENRNKLNKLRFFVGEFNFSPAFSGLSKLNANDSPRGLRGVSGLTGVLCVENVEDIELVGKLRDSCSSSWTLCVNGMGLLLDGTFLGSLIKIDPRYFESLNEIPKEVLILRGSGFCSSTSSNSSINSSSALPLNLFAIN